MPRSSLREPEGIALRMKQARIRLEWTQEELSRKVRDCTGIPISISTIKQYEENIRSPSSQTIRLISQLFAQFPESYFCNMIIDNPVNGNKNEDIRLDCQSNAHRTVKTIRHINLENHQVECSAENVLVRWRGVPSLRGIKLTYDVYANELNNRLYRGFIVDMSSSGTPDLTARQWSSDWLRASEIAGVVVFGASVEIILALMMMFDTIRNRGYRPPTAIFCDSESEAKSYFAKIQQCNKV